jgi:hypothetical protein
VTVWAARAENDPEAREAAIALMVSGLATAMRNTAETSVVAARLTLLGPRSIALMVDGASTRLFFLLRHTRTTRAMASNTSAAGWSSRSSCRGTKRTKQRTSNAVISGMRLLAAAGM